MSPVLVLDLVSLVKVSIGVSVIFFLPQENSGRGELHQIKTKMVLKKRPFLGNLQLAYSGFQIVEWVSFLLKSLCAWNRLIRYKKNGLSVHNIEKMALIQVSFLSLFAAFSSFLMIGNLCGRPK